MSAFTLAPSKDDYSLTGGSKPAPAGGLSLAPKPGENSLGPVPSFKAPPAPSIHPAAPTAAPADNGLTEFLNKEMLGKGGPTHPGTGVYLKGPWRGKTPDQVREKLTAQHANPRNGRGPGAGIQGGAGLTDETSWRGTFGEKTNPATAGTGAGATAPFRGSTPGEVAKFQAPQIATSMNRGIATKAVPNLPGGQVAMSTIAPQARTAPMNLAGTKGAAGFKAGIGTQATPPAPKPSILPFPAPGMAERKVA